ncbi:MAG: PEP-CTERM sorting domain-containing protein [Candidatus Solibacter usitatus]|nr:PEP-CTERM sorting domain-containing protein [Candidatus Solibacter usitatus]
MGLASLGSNPFVGGQAQDQAETSGSLGVAASTPSAPASAPAPSNTLTFGWNTLTDDTSAQSTASFGPSAAPCADPTAPNCSTAAPSQAAPVIQLASALGASLVDDTNLIAIEVIPEPGTAILMGAGLLAVALGAMRRRRIRE